MRRKTDIFDLMRMYPELGAFIVYVIVILAFSVGSPALLTIGPLTAIFTVAAELGIVALGVSMLMISGEFDISVGSVFLISTLIFSVLANAGVAVPTAFLLTLAACALMGLLNGVITVGFGIPSFITTLGTMMLWRGITIVVTGGSIIRWKASKDFLQILGGNPFSMFRLTGLWFVVLTVFFYVILHKTRYGNWVFATGGNVEAARNVGVNVQRVKLINFTLCGLLAGFSGAVNMARFNMVQAQLGRGKELEAIAACVIGGNLLMGGKGSILGAFIGALFLSTIKTGVIMLGMSSDVYLGVTGIIIIVTVTLHTYTTRLSR